MSDADLELLARYTRHHAEEAFAEIVRRHLDLVFSAALRQVRSTQLAEEVAQTTFLSLARDANRLAPDTILAAWLYQVAHRTAANVVRRESRRQLREQIATEMNAMNATESSRRNPMEADADWTHIEPLLDEAMHALDDTDRTAVLLRYFENKSLREVGATLGTSENAAQKRLGRAVERLREFFAKRGVTVGTQGLVVVISANAIQAAPVGLAATLSTAAVLAGTTLTTTATATATKAIAMTITQKVLITTVLAAAASTGIYEARQASTLRTEAQHLQQQQSQLTAQNEQLTRERDDALRQATAPRDSVQSARSISLPPEQMTELLRLRGEVGRLRDQEREIGRLRREQMQIAEIKVAHAQAEFDRLTKLHAEKLVSAHELGQAGFAVELLKAQAKDNIAGAAQIRVQQAEADLEHVSKLYQLKLVSEAEYSKAKYAVDECRAELRGDDVEVGQIKLRKAEAEFARAAELRRRSLISEGDYNEALLRVELLRGRTNR